MIKLVRKIRKNEFLLCYDFITDLNLYAFMDLIYGRCEEILSNVISPSFSVSEARIRYNKHRDRNESPFKYLNRVIGRRTKEWQSSTYDKRHPIRMQLPDGTIENGIVRISDHRVDLGTWAKNNDCNYGISIVVGEAERKYPNERVPKNRRIRVWEYVFDLAKSRKESLLIEIGSNILDLEGLGDIKDPTWTPDTKISRVEPTEVTNEQYYTMKKGDIERMIKEAVLQRTGSVTFKKGELKLREDIKGSIYVSPSKEAGATNDMGNDIQNAMQDNPGQKNFTLQPGDYSTNATTNDVSVDINAQNGSDAENQINQQMKNPVMRSLADQGKLTTNITLNNSKEINDRLKKLEEGVHFKKGELDAFLKSL